MQITHVSDAAKEEITEFVSLLQKLDRDKQRGLYLMIKGAAVLTGNKKEIFS